MRELAFTNTVNQISANERAKTGLALWMQGRWGGFSMSDQFFDRPILNSPYEYPSRHWELDNNGQPTQQILNKRRGADFITPIPKVKTREGGRKQE